MTVKVKLHTYLVTDGGAAAVVPCDHKMNSDELKKEREQHDSVYYAGVREFIATVVADEGGIDRNPAATTNGPEKKEKSQSRQRKERSVNDG